MVEGNKGGAECAVTPRKPLSRAVRFEVFKRDQFKCQYCGGTAPEVVLHVDHIEPVSKGGDNELTNLITACGPCNLGKRDKRLDDSSAVMKSRAQLEELQERREQLEMMMEWRTGLRELADETVDRLVIYWQKLAPGYVLNENGKATVKRLQGKYTVESIMKAMDTAADQYLRFDEKGKATSESWEKAFDMVQAILRVERECAENPELRELYFIRGILRNRMTAKSVNWYSLRIMKDARACGVPIAELKSLAGSVWGWTAFCDGIEELKSRYAPTKA
jgi:hypothetical protein